MDSLQFTLLIVCFGGCTLALVIQSKENTDTVARALDRVADAIEQLATADRDAVSDTTDEEDDADGE